MAEGYVIAVRHIAPHALVMGCKESRQVNGGRCICQLVYFEMHKAASLLVVVAAPAQRAFHAGG